jgi:hypothetical protein
MGKEQERQLEDYLEVVESKVGLPHQVGMVRSNRLVYAFLEPPRTRRSARQSTLHQ